MLSDPIQAAFETFHLRNPTVYLMFMRFAYEAKRAGRIRYSADAILHRIRWHTSVETTGPVYKINDHYSSRYADMLMAEHPIEFKDFFETRARKSLIPA